MALNEQQIAQAVELLAGSHQQKQPLSALPDDCLPSTAALPAFLDTRSEWQGRFDGIGDVTVRFTD